MTPPASVFDSILTAEAMMPSRWEAGEERTLKLILHNRGMADLDDAEVRISWRALGDEGMQHRRLGLLKRLSGHAIEESLLPVRVTDKSAEVQVVFSFGSHLRLTLAGTPLPAEVRRLKGEGGNVHIHAPIHQGDKAGMGAMHVEGAHGVGHQINFQRNDPAGQMREWLDMDPAAGRPASLSFRIVLEECRDWRSHCGIDLAGIAAGRFRMGASPGDTMVDAADEQARDLTMSQGYWIGRYPVTQTQFEFVTGGLPELTEAFRGADKPVVQVTWLEAVAFCEELTRKERAASGLPPGYAYRLPTEAEWEYACRAGTEEASYGPLFEIGSCKDNQGGLCAVGSWQPNPWRLHDMLGLVYEWCLDAAGPYRLMELENPVRLEPDPGQPLKRIIRGGCFMGPDSDARASARAAADPDRRSGRIGFRVVLARAE